MKKSDRLLRGEKNMCPTCGEYFNSNFAFDKHRTGNFGLDRRCKSITEMFAAGMVKNAADWWVSAQNPKYHG